METGVTARAMLERRAVMGNGGWWMGASLAVGVRLAGWLVGGQAVRVGAGAVQAGRAAARSRGE